MKRHRQFFTVLFMLWSVHLFAQDPNNLAVDGTIKDENGGRITGARITLFQDGLELDNVQTGKNGRFDLYLDFGHEFIIEIAKSGYVSKKLYINTNNVPEDEQAWGYEFGGFVVDMFRRMDGVDYSILEQPIGKVYYEPNVENFVDDRLYTRQIKDKVDELEDAQKERIKQEEERLARLEEDFQLAIRDAEQAISDGDYLLAKDNLLAAQDMKPSSDLPKQMLSEVEAKLANSEAKEEKYQSLLASADQQFGSKNYPEAIRFYNEALAVKPEEGYPKEKISESEKLLEEQLKQQEQQSQLAAKEKEFNDALALANTSFENEKYRDAITYSNRALEIKEDEAPKQLIKRSEELLKEQQAAQATATANAQEDAIYSDKVDKADAAFKAGNLELAKDHYRAANEIKPDERYPRDQIAAIDQKLGEIAQNQKRKADAAAIDEKYASLVQSGERYYKAGDLQNALSRFKEAQEVKPEEVYSAEQISKIQGELDRMAQIDAEQSRLKEAERAYLIKVEEANKLFNAGKFKEARPIYEEAQALRPDEKHPATQIARIDAEVERQAREKEKAEQYASAIEQADQLFEQEKWKEAIAVYEKASGFKPSEPYPKIKIGDAQKRMDQVALIAADQQAKDEKEAAFKALVAEGDKFYEDGDLKGAVNKYDQALRIHADEYARGQVQKISKELAQIEQEEKVSRQQAEIDRQYQEAIVRADQQFNVGNYEEAKVTYNVALGYRADEAYPKQRLAEIEEKLSELAERRRQEEAEKQKREQYELYLKSGNEDIANREYASAKENFEAALNMFPDEGIPKRKLDLIKDLQERERIAIIQQEYQSAISKADRAFAAEEYENAIPLYEAAREIKPDENYPTQRINKINEILVELANKAKQAEEDSRKRVIEETYDEGRTKVTIRRVMMNGKEDVYKRVIHQWGGKYYFLNEQPITELVWSRETAK